MLNAVKMALRGIRFNKMRSFLTMLGIIIGVVAVVMLMSIGAGAGKTITGSIYSLGAGLISAQITDEEVSVTAEELKSYLQQYEQEVSSERHTLCRNAAVDAIAGYYDQTAQKKGVPVCWRIDIPEKIVMSEADLCVALGNLLENALRASEKLPPEVRQVEVFCRLISPAMLGLIVENRYNGCLKREGGAILSTEHDGVGQGLTSVETIARKYRGQMTVETKDGLFRVNVLFNF